MNCPEVVLFSRCFIVPHCRRYGAEDIESIRSGLFHGELEKIPPSVRSRDGIFSNCIIFRTTDSLNSGLYLFIFIAPPECRFTLLSHLGSSNFHYDTGGFSMMTPILGYLLGRIPDVRIVVIRFKPFCERHYTVSKSIKKK